MHPVKRDFNLSSELNTLLVHEYFNCVMRRHSEERGIELLTDGINKVIEGPVCEEWLRKLPEEHLESARGDVDVFPLTVIQLHLLI